MPLQMILRRESMSDEFDSAANKAIKNTFDSISDHLEAEDLHAQVLSLFNSPSFL